MSEHALKKKKILVVRFSSIGDIILTTPVIRCLKNRYPENEIHFLTKKKYLNLLVNNPNIETIFVIDQSLNEVIGQLKKEHYDFVVDLHRNMRTFLLRMKLRIPFFTFPKLNFRKWLVVSLKYNRLPDVHIVNRMIHALRKLSVTYDGNGLDYYHSSEISIPENIQLFIQTNPNFYVFSIGGSYFTKRCPTHKVVEICNAINKPVILTGGNSDQTNGEIISRTLGKMSLNCCGKIAVEQSAYLIGKSRFLISNDTGMMHIGSALKKPVISLWGNTIPAFGMTPLLPEGFNPQPAIIEENNLSCRPCSKLGFQKCPKKHFKCMNELEVTEIIKYLSDNSLD